MLVNSVLSRGAFNFAESVGVTCLDFICLDCLSGNRDLSSLSVRGSILSILSFNLYPHSYHNLADQSYPHTAHAHGVLHNHYIEDNMK